MKRAIVLTEGNLLAIAAKTSHALARGSSRFRIIGIIASQQAGKKAGEIIENSSMEIPIFASIKEALLALPEVPEYSIVGIATHGGKLTKPIRSLIIESLKAGISIVNGLHDYAGEDSKILAAARNHNLEIIDVRKPKPINELHFWTGEIYRVKPPRIAVLGMDCAIGKRTTARLLVDACNNHGIKTEMIYTGQTGWLQGADYGFVLDSVPNDFVSGELEHSILTCCRSRSPDLIIIEGQSSLRNPSGPCGSEILVSGAAHAVILQHAPGRTYFEGFEEFCCRIPTVEEEIKLIEMYGSQVIAVCLNKAGIPGDRLEKEILKLRKELELPVIDPMAKIEELIPVVKNYIKKEMTGDKNQ